MENMGGSTCFGAGSTAFFCFIIAVDDAFAVVVVAVVVAAVVVLLVESGIMASETVLFCGDDPNFFDDMILLISRERAHTTLPGIVP